MAEQAVSAASEMQRSDRLEVVDICQYRVCRDPSRVLVTYALGSCVAVAVHDPTTRVGGLIHFMLPEHKVDPAKAKVRPAMFGDTGLPQLFKEIYASGARKENLEVFIIGGAATLGAEGNFNIGKRNAILAKKLFWKSGITLKGEDVGGSDSRTVYLSLTDGRVIVKRPGGKEDIL